MIKETNDEIKEIIDYISERVIQKEKWNKIKDYITTLEQAVKDTKDSADDMLYELKQELEEEKRIEEADLKTIQRLEEENEELKSKLECYENGVYYSSKVDELEQENERLKVKTKEQSLLLIDYQDMEQRYNDYKSRCGKALNILNNIYMLDNVTITNNACEKIDEAINILRDDVDE